MSALIQVLNTDIGDKMQKKTPNEMAEELSSAGYKEAAELIKMLCRETAELFRQRDVLLRLLDKHS